MNYYNSNLQKYQFQVHEAAWIQIQNDSSNTNIPNKMKKTKALLELQKAK
jgi:hypothetical protein